MKRKDFSYVILILAFLVGMSLLLYPSVSDYWNSLHQSRAVSTYNEEISSLTVEDYAEYFKEAEKYNELLKMLSHPFAMYDKVAGYEETLDAAASGVMAYLSIPTLNVELPIYHGTSEEILNVAVGHLQGSSLPIGGLGTHTVLSAHRGLPSARLFTDLDKLVVGDIFTIKILDRLLTYQVDQILIVKPDEVQALAVDEEQDYCTLVTCTPYGINSHRLLVRGTRIENIEEAKQIIITSDAMQIDTLIVACVVAVPILLILFIILLFTTRKKKGGSNAKAK